MLSTQPNTIEGVTALIRYVDEAATLQREKRHHDGGPEILAANLKAIVRFAACRPVDQVLDQQPVGSSPAVFLVIGRDGRTDFNHVSFLRVLIVDTSDGLDPIQRFCLDCRLDPDQSLRASPRERACSLPTRRKPQIIKDPVHVWIVRFV